MSKAALPLGGIAGEGGREGGRKGEGGREGEREEGEEGGERREGREGRRGEYEKTNMEVFHKAQRRSDMNNTLPSLTTTRARSHSR